VSPFLWFDDDAEQALESYAGVFANSEIVNVTRMDVPTMPNDDGEDRVRQATGRVRRVGVDR
jgi:predicted 3-demethylubiquinone-9 3-methyltransferase (glyoxalase superfamily)